MRLLKWLHLLGLAGFGSGMAAQLVLERSAAAGSRATAARETVHALAVLVTGPSLLTLLASGMLMLALRPALLEQRWLWAKLLLTMVIAPAAWFGMTPAAMALALGLTLPAVALAVWQPRLGAPPGN